MGKRTLISSCLFVFFIAACGNSDDSEQEPDTGVGEVEGGGIECLNPVGPVPDEFETSLKDAFDKYTYVETPNGKRIDIFGQNNVSSAKLDRACAIMRFYLEAVPGSTYGEDKTAVADHMGDVRATLVYFNTESSAEATFDSIGDIDFFGQDLYATESPMEGSEEYLNHSVRDASYEEIFHLVHGAGIENGLPAYQADIREATDTALANDIFTPPPDLLEEWVQEGSDDMEYIISVIDVYYGLWAHEEGPAFNGEYQLSNRDELATGDPLGLAAVEAYLPSAITHQVKLDPSFEGTFTLTFTPSLSYTHKSRYLKHVGLTGEKSSNLTGNSLDNSLAGNSGDNTLSGEGGTDTAFFKGEMAEYSIAAKDDCVVVEDTIEGRDGRDTLLGIEQIQFSDQTIETESL